MGMDVDEPENDKGLYAIVQLPASNICRSAAKTPFRGTPIYGWVKLRVGFTT